MPKFMPQGFVLAVLLVLAVIPTGCASKYCTGLNAVNPYCVNRARSAERQEERHKIGMAQAREQMRQQFDQQEATLERQRPHMTDDDYQILKIQIEDQRKAQGL